MKKQINLKTLLQNANRFENIWYGTSGIKYYRSNIFTDTLEDYENTMFSLDEDVEKLYNNALDDKTIEIKISEDKTKRVKAIDLLPENDKALINDFRDNILFMLLERNILRINYIPRALFTSYLEQIGKTKEQISLILNLCFQYNNISLEYFHIGTFKEFLQNLEYTEEQINKFNEYGLRKEVIKCLESILECSISLDGYTQNRDIRYGNALEQFDFEEEAFKEDGKRMSEYTAADGYEISENYVCSYDNTITLSTHFLQAMGIDSKNGYRLTLENGKDVQIFDNLILEAIKNMRLMRIPGIDTFATLIKQIYVNDGNLTKSTIELFNSELGNMIKIIEDPECYKYIMMPLSDLAIFDYSDCLLLYSKICRILDLTEKDILNLLKNAYLNEKDEDILNKIDCFTEDLFNELDMEIVTYYDDNLDYQDDEAEGVDYTNSDNLVIAE